MMARHLSQKVVLGWIQLSLGLCGLALLIYVPLSSYSCRNSLALITVRQLSNDHNMVAQNSVTVRID